nr:acyl-coenzyme A thioesterase 13 isoform X2 [Oryza sativa Japonica Group]
MDPEAVRRSLEPTALSKEVVGPASASLRYDAFALTGVRIDAAEHGRLLCSFVVTPRIASPAGYLLSGVTATLADQLGSGVFLSSGIGTSGVSLELNLSYVDVASIGVKTNCAVDAAVLSKFCAFGAYLSN